MSYSTTQTDIYSLKLYSETLEIFRTNYLRLMTISLLFIPFIFSTFSAIQFYYSSPEPFNLFLLKTIFTFWKDLRVLTFICFVVLPTTAAGVALITYSTYQSMIHNTPTTLSSAIKSLPNTFRYVLSIIIHGSIKVILNSLLLVVSPPLLTASIQVLGFYFKYSILVNTIFSYLMALNILYLIVIWGSAAPIAVLESKSHFMAYKTFQQSANQSFEFRWFSLYTVFLAGLGISPTLYAADQMGYPTTWFSILEVCVIYLYSSVIILMYVLANTVLYVQYKAISGEEIGETTTVEGEVSSDYVSLA